VLEGEVLVHVGEDSATLAAGTAVLAPADIEHGVENRSAARATLLVFMAPRP
jgi:quercetin dioxygenase-like cupin family protein